MMQLLNYGHSEDKVRLDQKQQNKKETDRKAQAKWHVMMGSVKSVWPKEDLAPFSVCPALFSVSRTWH